MRSEYPIAEIWRANTGDTPPEGELVVEAGAAGALVLRPALAVSVESLTPGRCAFAEALLAGGDLAAAHAAAASLEEEFDVIPAFRDLLAAGAFAGVADQPSEGG